MALTPAKGRNPRKGERTEGSGRQTGSRNKVTLQIKEALLQSFKNVGGIKYLERLAREEPRAYASLLARIIPAELHAEISGGATVVVLRNYTGIDWEHKAKAAVEASEQVH